MLFGWRTICAVEKEPYCREVLLRRQRDGVLPLFPIWDDIRTFDGRPWRGKVDLVTAGFPCQPWSVAGQHKGKQDERNLWPDTLRVLGEVGAPFAFLENVPGLLSHDYFGEILGGLADERYDAWWDVVSAQETGAPHIRKRLWIVAYTNQERLPECADQQLVGEGGLANPQCERELQQKRGQQNKRGRVGYKSKTLANSKKLPQSGEGGARFEPCCGGWWRSEPDVGRVASRVAFRVDRLRALGEGQVPAVVRRAWIEILMSFSDKKP